MNRENIFEQLKIDEGVKYEVYLDHLGYPTFGVGHLIQKTDPEFGAEPGTPISEERVWEAFEVDLETAVNECYALYGPGTFTNFPSEVQEVLVNMMFNMGRPRLSGFKKFNAALLESDWSKAADEMVDSLWYRQVGVRATRLWHRMKNV
jgi:lysozyme